MTASSYSELNSHRSSYGADSRYATKWTSSFSSASVVTVCDSIINFYNCWNSEICKIVDCAIRWISIQNKWSVIHVNCLWIVISYLNYLWLKFVLEVLLLWPLIVEIFTNRAGRKLTVQWTYDVFFLILSVGMQPVVIKCIK